MVDFFYKYGLVLELWLPLILFTLSLKKRKLFFLRMLLIPIAIGIFCFVRSASPINSVFEKIVIYMILYFVLFLLNYFIYDAQFRIIVYCTMGGIIAQHVAYTLSDLVRYFLLPSTSLLWANIVYAILAIIINIVLFLSFSFNQDPRDFIRLQKGPIIISTIMIFIICIIVLQFFEYYRSQVIFPYYILFVVLDMTCCLTIYLIQKISYLSARDTIGKEIMKNRLHQYESLQSVIEVMNIRIHDLKHQIRKLEKDNSVSPDVIKQLNDTISKYKNFSRCGNDIIDTILTEKNIKFEKEQIKFTYNFNGRLFNHFSIQDINSVFGNALDNAIESLITLPPEKRFLTIRSFEKGNIAIISFENTFYGKPSFNKDGLLNTTKESSIYHGFGLRSIRSTVKKYNGNMTITIEEGTFKLQLLIPQDNIETKEKQDESSNS